jgi:catechol 2,3-dioxygenase-like lactoylglutathione lyase family enzyme
MPASVCLETAPYLIVDDVVASATYWRDVLGFSVGDYFGDPPVFVIVRRNAARVMLRQAPASARPALNTNTARFPAALDLYIWVSDVAALHAELQLRGATIVHPPESEGDRLEMLVRDVNGYTICFGEIPDWRA